ncbi:hypothetical protein PMW_09 [Pseudomonas phage phiPMW]|uniref:Uncharacterized protein n=1 Tax=Pseudomonas phage phiPMW TaxID=1815582 RepID=A0A1S5R148_9CAUD|nr:hypothetical protein FDG97_gp009 [Pseudomonas phage phiPMW]ANA49134.1 hypothetical protein PMW_09 [Pseudomonas phage phiPMW]
MTTLQMLGLGLGVANLVVYYGFGGKEHNFYSGVAALVATALSIGEVFG